MEIDLTPEQIRCLDAAVDSGRFMSVAEAIQDALDAWVARETQRDQTWGSGDEAEAAGFDMEDLDGDATLEATPLDRGPPKIRDARFDEI